LNFLRERVHLDTVAVTYDSPAESTETARIEMLFSTDHNEFAGDLTDSGSSKVFDVRLPWEWRDAFWRAISDEDCIIAISWNADKKIINFGTWIKEGSEGAADKEQRERIEAMWREV
jgi:hypothetical protein